MREGSPSDLGDDLVKSSTNAKEKAGAKERRLIFQVSVWRLFRGALHLRVGAGGVIGEGGFDVA
jgi:hypothetical protein